MKNIILYFLFLLGFSGLVKPQTFEHFRVDTLRGSYILRSNFDSRGDTAIRSSYFRIKDQSMFKDFVKKTLLQAVPLSDWARLKDNSRITLQFYVDKTGKMYYGQFLMSRELLSLFSDEELFRIYRAFQKQPLDMNNIDLRQPDGMTIFFTNTLELYGLGCSNKIKATAYGLGK